MDILEALTDPELFGGLFDAPSWRPWKAFLAALFALPMDDADLALYRHHTGRIEPPRAPFREACLVCGRRGGKSRILALVAVYLATIVDYGEHTAPGETPVVAIIAADRKQARVILGYIIGLLHAVPALEALIEDELTESVRLNNGTSIEVHTSSIGAPRGRTFIAVLADEIAFWDTGDAANPDTEVINAVRPGLASIPTSILLAASSPYARRGFLFNTFARYYGKDAAPVLVWKGSTLEMNSALDPRIVEEAFESDPESAEAEYGANFRTDITAFIGRDAVEAVVADGVIEVPPAAGIQYAAFVDPSGGSADSMTIAVGHIGADGIAVLDATRERKPPFSPEDVVEEFAELLRAYRVTRIQGDAYAGEWPRERFASHGISYELSSRNKNAIYRDFLPALNGQRVRLLDHSRLIAQLCNLERRTARGGRDSIDHGPGQHDDLANSVCGALTSVINDRRPALIPSSSLLVENAGVPLGPVMGYFATLWIGLDGTAAWALFAYAPDMPVKLMVHDFEAQPWGGALLETVATRLDMACETTIERFSRCRERGMHAWMWVPAQVADAAKCAMRDTFMPRFTRPDAPRRKIGARVIDAAYLADPVALAFNASAHVAAGLVKLSVQAAERSRGIPLLGALATRPGERVEADPLRVSLLLGIAGALDPEPARIAPAVPVARAEFRGLR